jgi:SAM-dependent methyltransferase
MTRNDKILYHISKQGHGIEIGPSFSPVAPKRLGYKVHVIDHLRQTQLVEKYKNANVPLNNIEDVDFVWTGQPYIELTGKRKFYDWIIASHVIEHVPDFIGFLNECDMILKDSGVLSLVVPDKRYCFDHFRPTTGLARVVDSHLNKDSVPTLGTVAEALLYSVSKKKQIAWASGSEGEYTFNHSLEEVLSVLKSIRDSGVYIDEHAWCFTPHSFRLLIHDLYQLGFISQQEISFFPTEGCEFFVTLEHQRQGDTPLNRLAILKAIEHENRDK